MMSNTRYDSQKMSCQIGKPQHSQSDQMAVNSQVKEIMTKDCIICEPCNISMHRNSYNQHIFGKKHLAKQAQYNKEQKTIFVSGVSGIPRDDLAKIFLPYGEVSSVRKRNDNSFAFIQFKDKTSVVKAVNAQVFARGKRLLVRKYEDKRNSIGEKKDKARKLSETSSNSQSELSLNQLGVPDLPFEPPDPDLSPNNEHFFEWLVQQFISQVELPDYRQQQLRDVINDINNLFNEVLPGCQAIIFGSCGTTLAFKNSDVDLFLKTVGEPPVDFVRREAKIIYRSRNFAVRARIPNARVPIIKFEHQRTGWEGDLSAKSQLGICNSRLIRFLVSLDSRVRPLIMVIKYWTKVCELSGSHGKLTTYAVVMLVIFYLQQLEPPVLPPIFSLQKMVQQKEYTLGWESSFCDDKRRVQSECLSQSSPSLSLRELLTGFFRYYYNLDFNTVVCPLLGKTLPVKNFESDNGTDLPEEMHLYKENLKSDPKNVFKTNTMLKVQDPFELCLNITRNINDDVCFNFKEACKVSLEFCEKEDDKNLLKSLFSRDILQQSYDDLVKIDMPLMLDSSENVADKDIMEWYDLTVNSIFLVLREIFKISVEPQCSEVSSKVKKLETSQDVHTSRNLCSTGERLTYVCWCNCDIWSHRNKIKKLPAIRNSFLSAFEKEVCISNALYQPRKNNSLTFTMLISSLEELKKDQKGIEVIFAKKKNYSCKGIFNRFRTSLRNMVQQAALFIKKVSSSSSEIVSNEALKEKFNLKLKMLPSLKELEEENGKKVELNKVAVEKSSTPSESERNEIPTKLNLPSENIEKDAKSCLNKVSSINSDGPSSNSNISGNVERQFCSISKKTMGESFNENEIMKTVISSENKPSAETQALIDEFFKPKSPDQLNALKSVDLSNSETGKFSEFLNKIQNIETQSTFTSEEVNNPFLASIENVAEKSLFIGNSASFQGEIDCKLKDKAEPNKNTLPLCNKHETVEERKEIMTNCSENNECFNIETIINDDKRNNLKSNLHRPNMYSERPLKHKKPNIYRNKSLTNCYSDSQGQSGSHGFLDDGHCYNPNTVDRQKVWYPSLFNPKNM